MLYRLSYASGLRREIAYHIPAGGALQGVSVRPAQITLGNRERTTSAALDAVHHTAASVHWASV